MLRFQRDTANARDALTTRDFPTPEAPATMPRRCACPAGDSLAKGIPTDQMEFQRQGRCAVRGVERRAFSGMTVSPSFTDLRRSFALAAAAAEDVNDSMVVMMGGGCVKLTGLTPLLVTTNVE